MENKDQIFIEDDFMFDDIEFADDNEFTDIPFGEIPSDEKFFEELFSDDEDLYFAEDDMMPEKAAISKLRKIIDSDLPESFLAYPNDISENENGMQNWLTGIVDGVEVMESKVDESISDSAAQTIESSESIPQNKTLSESRLQHIAMEFTKHRRNHSRTERYSAFKSHPVAKKLVVEESKVVEKAEKKQSTEVKHITSQTEKMNIQPKGNVSVKSRKTKQKRKKDRKSLLGRNDSNPVKKILLTAIVVFAISLYFAIKANSAWIYFMEGNMESGFGDTSAIAAQPGIIKCIMTSLTDDAVGISIDYFSAGTFFGTFFIMAGICAVVCLLVWADNDTKKRQRDGHEHGKARLATAADFRSYRKKFMENSDYNMLFSERIGLSLDNKKTNRSANVLVIGGTGTGKTFRYIKPNILQENSSQIITDPSGDLFRSFGPYLIQKGYNVYLFNVSDMGMSCHYNPLLNVYDADGEIDSQKVDVLVDLYMKNASAGKENSSGDPFWEKSEKAFLTGVIYYVLENDDISREEKCFNTVLQKVQLARADESKKGADAETMLTKEIKKWQAEMEKQGRNIKCPLYYDTFLIAPQKTANTILITTAVDLQIFSNEHVDRITRWNPQYPDLNINLDDIGSTQTYVFLGIPQSHQAYNFLIAMLYSQLYSRLYDLGERGYVGKWLLEETPGIPKFVPFDSQEDAVAFQNDCALYGTDKDTGRIKLVELPYINNTKIYRIYWEGRTDEPGWKGGSVYKQYRGIYKKSFVRKPLEELIKKAPSMNLRCNNETPQLPIHVNFLLDEFKNIGEIPNFLTILSTSRKYRIGSHAIIQDIAQIKTMYPDEEHQTLLANVDTTIFLGSILTDDKETIQKMMGKTTIKQRSTSTSKQGITTSYTPTEVDLMSIDEIGKINEGDRNDCIVIVRDITPFVDKKLNLLEHKRWPDVCAAKGFDHEIYYKNNVENGLFG